MKLIYILIISIIFYIIYLFYHNDLSFEKIKIDLTEPIIILFKFIKKLHIKNIIKYLLKISNTFQNPYSSFFTTYLLYNILKKNKFIK